MKLDLKLSLVITLTTFLFSYSFFLISPAKVETISILRVSYF